MRLKKIRTFEFLNCLIFIMIFTFRSITDALFIANGEENSFLVNVKYILIVLAIIFCFLQKKKENNILKKELRNIIIVVVTLLFISLITAMINNKFYMETFESVFKMILPIIYVYYFINVMSFEYIYKAMVGALFGSFVGYVIEIGTGNFTMSNLKMLDFSSSYSPFESSFAAGASIAFCVFFMYYRKNKLITIFSFVFAILTFKRLSVLFALILIILPKIIDVNKKVNKKYRLLCIWGFILLTIIYYNLLLPQNSSAFYKIFGDTQDSFTMGRSSFLRTFLSKGKFYPGLGSTTAILGKGLEMDLIRIYLETSILGLSVFVWGYWNYSGDSKYTYIYMLFQFFNLLTSHSLSNSFNWILTLITISCITYKKHEDFKFIKIKGV